MKFIQGQNQGGLRRGKDLADNRVESGMGGFTLLCVTTGQIASSRRAGRSNLPCRQEKGMPSANWLTPEDR